MTQLATRGRERAGGDGGAQYPATAGGNLPAVAMSLDDVYRMAECVFQSRLFPSVTSAQAACTLMLICQSDGLHPIQAMRMYDIIDGKPAMKAQAIQARFQEAGGRIKIIRSDATEARATFAHPVHQPEPFEMAFTIKDAERAKLAGKKNWVENPTDMLWARLVSKGVRKVMPGIVVGIYSSEEVRDMDPPAPPGTATGRLEAPRRPAPPPVDPAVVGYSGTGPDTRAYPQLVLEAVGAVNAARQAEWARLLDGDVTEFKPANAHDVHRYLLHAATNLGYYAGAAPKGMTKAIEALAGVYKAERAWVRAELTRFLADCVAKDEEALESSLMRRSDARLEAAEAGAESVPDAGDDAAALAEFGPGAADRV